MIETELKRFHELFGYERVRELGNKLEYRVRDLDESISEARQIIINNKLNLVAETDGSMASYRAFEVRWKG